MSREVMIHRTVLITPHDDKVLEELGLNGKFSQIVRRTIHLYETGKIQVDAEQQGNELVESYNADKIAKLTREFADFKAEFKLDRKEKKINDKVLQGLVHDNLKEKQAKGMLPVIGELSAQDTKNWVDGALAPRGLPVGLGKATADSGPAGLGPIRENTKEHFR